MIAILEFLILFFLLPYILFGVVLAKIWEAVCTFFQPVLLLLAVWICSIGMFLLPSMEPHDRPWMTILEAIAQSHVFGLQTPFVIFGIAACVVIVSVAARQRNPAH